MTDEPENKDYYRSHRTGRKIRYKQNEEPGKWEKFYNAFLDLFFPWWR